MSEPRHWLISDIFSDVGTDVGKEEQALGRVGGTVSDVPPHSDIFLFLVRKKEKT
jgi:hypothetical protein